MLTTILITAAVATPVGYLVGAMIAGSKVIDAERRVDSLTDQLTKALHERELHKYNEQDLRTRLDRLTDRDERGRFVRREVDNGARPQEGRFKL